MLVSNEEAYFGLCAECGKKLQSSFLQNERCAVCGKPLISEINICMHCRKSEDASRDVSKDDGKETFLNSMAALYPYSGIYRQLLYAYKFKQYKQLSHFLTLKLIETGNGLRTKNSGTLTWVPVPPRPGKINQNGWDQIDYLADVLEKEKKVPISKCLRRLNTKAQKTLNRDERLSNLKGQIICSGKAPKNAVIFDDVVTTGATVEACAEALRKAGTEYVYAVCLFYD